MPDFAALQPASLAPPIGNTLDYGIGSYNPISASDDDEHDRTSGKGNDNEGDVSSARKQLEYDAEDVAKGGSGGGDEVQWARAERRRGGALGAPRGEGAVPAGMLAAAAEARGVWAARQLSARVDAVVWDRACAEHTAQAANEIAGNAEAEARAANENARAAQDDAAVASTAAVAAEAARADADLRAAAAEAAAAAAVEAAAAAVEEADAAKARVHEDGQSLLSAAEAARAEATASVVAANRARVWAEERSAELEARLACTDEAMCRAATEAAAAEARAADAEAAADAADVRAVEAAAAGIADAAAADDVAEELKSQAATLAAESNRLSAALAVAEAAAAASAHAADLAIDAAAAADDARAVAEAAIALATSRADKSDVACAALEHDVAALTAGQHLAVAALEAATQEAERRAKEASGLRCRQPLLSARVGAARRSRKAAVITARAAHTSRRAAELDLAQMAASSAAAAAAAATSTTKLWRELAGEKRIAEAAHAVADQAASELAAIARKQEVLKRALKNAGDRLRSAQKESAVTLRGLEARVGEAETALRDAQHSASAGVRRAVAAESEVVRLRAAARDTAAARVAAQTDAAASAAALSDLSARVTAAEATAAAAAAAALVSERGAESLAQAGEARGERVRELRNALAAALEAKAAAEERLASDVGRLEMEVHQLVAFSHPGGGISGSATFKLAGTAASTYNNDDSPPPPSSFPDSAGAIDGGAAGLFATSSSLTTPLGMHRESIVVSAASLPQSPDEFEPTATDAEKKAAAASDWTTPASSAPPDQSEASAESAEVALLRAECAALRDQAAAATTAAAEARAREEELESTLIAHGASSSPSTSPSSSPSPSPSTPVTAAEESLVHHQRPAAADDGKKTVCSPGRQPEAVQLLDVSMADSAHDAALEALAEVGMLYPKT